MIYDGYVLLESNKRMVCQSIYFPIQYYFQARDNMGNSQPNPNHTDIFPSSEWRRLCSTPHSKTFQNIITKDLSQLIILHNLTIQQVDSYKERNIISSAYLPRLFDLRVAPQEDKEKDTPAQQNIKVYTCSMMVESVSVRLADYQILKRGGILEMESGYLLKKLEQVLYGFQFLFEKYGPFKIEPNQIGWTRNQHTKVWLNQNFYLNHKCCDNASEAMMVEDIFGMFGKIMKLPKLIIKNFNKAAQMIKTLENPKITFNFNEERMNSPKSNIIDRRQQIDEKNNEIESAYQRVKKIKGFVTVKNIEYNEPNKALKSGSFLQTNKHIQPFNPHQSQGSQQQPQYCRQFKHINNYNNNIQINIPTSPKHKFKIEQNQFNSRNSFGFNPIPNKDTKHQLINENEKNKSLQKVKFTFVKPQNKQLQIRNTASSINISINNNHIKSMPQSIHQQFANSFSNIRKLINNNLEKPNNCISPSLRSSVPIKPENINLFKNLTRSPSPKNQYHSPKIILYNSHNLNQDSEKSPLQNSFKPRNKTQSQVSVLEQQLESMCGGEAYVYSSQDMKNMENGDRWHNYRNKYMVDHIKENQFNFDNCGNNNDFKKISYRQNMLPLINEEQHSAIIKGKGKVSSANYANDSRLEEKIEDDLDALFESENGGELEDEKLDELKNELEEMF